MGRYYNLIFEINVLTIGYMMIFKKKNIGLFLYMFFVCKCIKIKISNKCILERINCVRSGTSGY